MNDWEMEKQSLDIILDYIKKHKPKVIVELGSGNSTKKIAQAIKYPCKFYSYEGKLDWYKKTKKLIRGLMVSLIYSPYIFNNNDRSTFWFNYADFKMKEINLLVIDAPEGIIGKLARYPAIYLKDRIKGTVFIHDTERPEEKTIANMWGEAEFYDTKWGLAKIIIK